MYIILDNLTGQYFTGNGFGVFKLALKMPKLRSEEFVESFNLQVARGWRSGEFVVLSAD